jgi:FlaA1/EpsC-like NDP-sugar epimerase
MPIGIELLELSKKVIFIQKYLTIMVTRSASKWLVLGIDLITIAVSFLLAYIIRFNMSLNFNWSLLELQLPLVALLALMVFLITGSYKGILGRAVNQDISNIFKAICLFCVLTILWSLINLNWEIYPDLMIPLSIIMIYSILAFVGLTGTHYLYRLVYSNGK